MRRSSLALLLLAACNGAQRPTETAANPRRVDVDGVRGMTATFKQYVNALLLFTNRDPGDWARAHQELDRVAPYTFSLDERRQGDQPGLIERAKAGDDAARIELGRRGQVYDALQMFWRKHDRAAWDAARSTITRLSVNHDGEAILASMLVLMLINGQLRDQWPMIRFQLTELREVSIGLLTALAEEHIKRTPETVIYKEDDLTQLFITICNFGDVTHESVKGYLAHPNHNVRKAAARAVGEARDTRYLDELNELLRETKSPQSWVVRAAAAESFARMEGSRRRAGPMLLAALKDEAARREESKGIVIVRIFRALGQIHYADAVPELIKDLDMPNLEWVEEVMLALYHITTKKEILSPEAWKRWYREHYEAWRAEWRKRYGE
jgi:hypothetical protein